MADISKTKKLLALLLITLAFTESKAQLVPLSLEQRVSNSTVVLEGKVISKSASWDEKRQRIYTLNLVSVYKVFKGTLTSQTIEIITRGGTVGIDREDVLYGLKLDVGSVGIFTCIPNNIELNKVSKLKRLKVYSEIQGFIKYDLPAGTAKDVFRQYKSIANDVYVPVQQLVNAKYRAVKNADFKIKTN